MKKRAAVACLFLLFFLMILLSGCFSQGKDPVTISRFLMDTKVDLTFYNIPHDEAKLLAEDVFAEMARLEELLSAHLENTDIHLLNSRAGKEAVTVSPQTAEVIKKSLELSEQTGGAFDITIAPVLQLWGFGEEKQLVPSPDQLEKALALVDYRNVTFKNSNLVKLEREGMRLDLGGIAKGYI
ncbi:MAG: FAD:protein FMN transferase, partial [Firmicutes bacterium]|nr:FAD:protein FMN transferase [Bacillota bacterium]